MTMLDQLPGIMLAATTAYAGYRFISGFFRTFDHLDAVIARWMCKARFRR
jgi:hypothetical protein